MHDHDQSYGLLLAFDTDDANFRRGIEVGRLWTQLEMSPEARTETVHADCAEMLIRIGEATGREYSAEDLGDGWLEVTFAADDE